MLFGLLNCQIALLETQHPALPVLSFGKQPNLTLSNTCPSQGLSALSKDKITLRKCLESINEQKHTSQCFPLCLKDNHGENYSTNSSNINSLWYHWQSKTGTENIQYIHSCSCFKWSLYMTVQQKKHKTILSFSTDIGMQNISILILPRWVWADRDRQTVTVDPRHKTFVNADHTAKATMTKRGTITGDTKLDNQQHSYFLFYTQILTYSLSLSLSTHTQETDASIVWLKHHLLHSCVSVLH